MLAAALDMVRSAGLTVSLEHISFEEVIRTADVSRSSAYRRWPHKDLFFSDLVRELAARDTTPALAADELTLIRQIVAEHTDWLADPGRRHDLVIELFRQLPLLDFQAFSTSAGWRTYIALTATYMSISDSTLREQVQAAMANAEQERIARVARAWELMCGLLGYRLRPECGATFETVATLLSATSRGIAIMALSLPGIGARRADARPFGTAITAEWSLPSLGLACIATALLEPDPDHTWDAGQVARLHELLAAPPG